MTYVETPRDLERAAARMHGVQRLAVDTESNSMHAYPEQVCFVQIRAEDDVFIIDTVRLRDLSALQSCFGDPSVEKILHGADYDVVCLARDFGLRFSGLYDTMLAAQFLGMERLGLASLCSHYFGVELDKSLTRHDWGLRPIDPPYLQYMCEDVLYLAQLRDILQEQVKDAGIEEELALEFQRVEKLEWSPKGFDPEGWRRIKGAKDLDEEARRVMVELFRLREELALERGVPPYRILRNEVMLSLARNRRARRGDLKGFMSLKRGFLNRYEKRLLAALRRARDAEPVSALGPRKTQKRPRAEVRREDALRRWRKEEAQRRGVVTMVVLPNHVLVDLVAEPPDTLDALKRFPYLGENRRERYGSEILEVLRAADSSSR